MNEILLILALAYAFFSALVLIAVIYSKVTWWIKAGLIVIAVGFYYASYHGWQNSQGWASKTDVPQQFLLHYAIIEEPNKEENITGQIFFWLSDIRNQQLSANPRAHVVPYSRPLHSKVEDALRKIREGTPQIGLSEPSKKRLVTELDPSQANEDEKAILFEDLPDLALPEK
ncbi:MAG: hypothetical protein AAGJ37_01155 [Pseudomonadota bacterium]